MSDTTYFSNAALVQSGDLFKIMELRYSHSIYDEDGYFNVKQPASNSLELIRWYRNSEAYFHQLLAEENEVATLSGNNFKLFRVELDKLVIDSHVFENFGVTEYSKECRMAYTKLQLEKYSLLIQDKNNTTKINEFLKDVYPIQEELKSIVRQPQRFDLDDYYQAMIEGLHSFFENKESIYFFAFDIEIEAAQFIDNSFGKWLLRAPILKLIFENALKHILKDQTDVLRFYVKLEDNGAYGYRFHTVVFFRCILIPFNEQLWLENFRANLERVLSDELLLKAWIKPLQVKKLEYFRNNRDLKELILSEEELNKDEEDINSEFERFYKIIHFQIINWNDKLRQLCPDLKFGFDPFNTIKDKKLLEYWGIKYLFLSNKYIHFYPHNEELNPSLKCFFNQSSEVKMGSDPIVIHKLPKDSESSVKNSTLQKNNSHNQIVQTNEFIALTQRRSGDLVDAFYNPERDFTIAANLSSISISSRKNGFRTQKIEKKFKIDVGLPSTDQIINLSTISVLQDFIDYILDDKNAICSVGIKNEKRISWAEIFYRSIIRDTELLVFLIKFERFIDVLLNSKNPFFAVKRQQACRPEDLSPIGEQFLELFFNFHMQGIANKINETDIRADHWILITKFFENNYEGDIWQVVMYQEQIQTLNDLMKKAQVLAKQYEQEIKPHLQHLKYADVKPWRKAFDQERVLMRCKFSLPYSLHDKLGITGIFNSFKTRLSGRDRKFKDVYHILICRKENQHEILDVLLMFDNAQGAEDQKWLSEHIEEIWGKAVNAAMKESGIQQSNYDLEELVSFVDFIPKHEGLMMKYLYIRNHEAAVEKSVISHLIPYFISQAIFLQDVSSGSTHKLSMSRYLTNLFDNKTPVKKVVSVATNKKSKAKSDSGVS